MRWKLHVRFGERAGETDQHERLTPRPGPTQPTPGVSHRKGNQNDINWSVPLSHRSIWRVR